MENYSKKKHLLFTSIALTGVALFGVIVASHGVHGSFLLNKVKADNTYNLTLDQSNRLTSNISETTSISRSTRLGNTVKFDYSNCNAESGYHAVINNGGVIVNADPLGGLTGIIPTFSSNDGQLMMRAGYSPLDFGAYVQLKSGEEFDFSGEVLPNFIELSASGGSVSLSSVGYAYDCTEYVEQSFTKVTSSLSDYSGTYLVVDENDSVALKSVNEAANTFNVTIHNNKILRSQTTDDNQLVITKSDSKYRIEAKDGTVLDYETSRDSNTLFWSGNYTSSISFTDGLFDISTNSHHVLYQNSKFTYYESSVVSGSRLVSLYKANFSGSTGSAVYDCGITVTDKRASSYKVGDVFDSFVGSKGLKVSVNKSDGSSLELESNQFTYEIKDGNTTIPSNTAFESTGTYIVNVSYKTYFTYSYSIIVLDASAASQDYELVTDVTDLEAGQSVIIVGIEDSKYYAMSKTQNDNNRGRDEITIEDGIAEVGSNTCEFELQEGNQSNTFAFYDETKNGYLCSASSSSNYLRTESSLSANSSFAITISNNEASIVSQGSYTRNTIRHNTGSDIFACYASGQEEVYLYAKGAAPKVLVTSVTLDKEVLSLEDGAEYSLTATVLPIDASNKELTWTSSNTSVATVNSNGKVTATGVGNATITATAKDGSGKSASCAITVSAIAVTGVSLNVNSLELFEGDSSTLTATISPSNASEKGLTWTSSDTSVATVNNGVVNALKKGTTTITVDTTDGHKQAQCIVTVKEVTVTGFSITEEEVEMFVGDDDLALTTVITPTNASNKTIFWSSSDTSVVTVSNGLLHAVAVGTATVTGTCNSISDEVEVTVRPADEKPTISYVNGEFGTGSNNSDCTVNGNDAIKVGTSKTGGTFKITIPAKTVKLSVYAAAWNGVSDLSLNITSDVNGVTTSPASIELDADSGISNNSPFTLSGNEADYLHEITLSGVITETTLTFSTSAAKRAVMWGPVCEVRSTPAGVVHAESVNVTPGSKTLDLNETVQLNAEVLPVDTTNKNVTWSSNKTNVATVSAAGLVTAKAYGTATITATTEDGGFTSTCAITVENSTVSVTGVTLSVSSKTIVVDEEFTLTATVAPSNATNKNVTWSTSNSGVATVSNGTVTGKAAGSATITVTTSDGNFTATCAVTVNTSGGGGGSSGSTGIVTDSLSAGQVVIMIARDADNEMTSISGYGVGTSYSNDTPAGSYQLTVEQGYSSGTWSFKTTDNTYVSWSSGNSLATSGSKNNSASWNVSFDSSGNATITNAGTSARQILWNVSSPRFAAYEGKSVGTSYYYPQLYRINTTPTDPTSISIPNTASLSLGKTTSLDVTYDSAANQNKEVNWYSSAASVASVDKTSGVITAVSTGTTKITAKLRINESIVSNQCTLTVQEVAGDKWTIMLYICGSNLESDYSSATDDIKEILGVSNQPNDINIIIETGGTTKWNMGSSYLDGATSIPKDQLGRWHVAGKKLVKDSFISQADMSATNTYKSFLQWGLENYPADKTGVILWNHGGGVDGVCFDDNFNNGYGSLLNSEMKSAHSSVITSGKLEFIGFDACLMQNMEIADFNSSYFNYQVASQESENGDGWYYTGWIDDLYANKATTVILQEICDQFISKEGGNQTLSYLNLSYASTFKTAWESYAGALKSKLSSGSVSGRTFATWVKSNVKIFGDEGSLGFGQFDVKNFVSKCQGNSSYAVDSSYATAVNNSLTNFIAYSRKGSSAGQANGLSCTYRVNDDVSYTSSETGFSTWLSFNNSYHY